MSEFLQVKPSKRAPLKQMLSLTTPPSENQQITHIFTMQKERKDECQNNQNIGCFKICIKSPKNQLKQNQNASNFKDFKTCYQNEKSDKENFTGYFSSYQSLNKIKSQPNMNLKCLCQYQTRSNIENGNSDFYKYWKEKANQYQSNNFNLLSNNSNLKLQIQKLKQENKSLAKKFQLDKQNEKSRAEVDEDKFRRIQQLQILNKQLGQKVILLTDKLKKLSFKLQDNQQRLSNPSNLKGEDLKQIKKEKGENEQIKTRWSLKEPKNKDMSTFWQEQFQISKIKNNKQDLENKKQKYTDQKRTIKNAENQNKRVI